jgi:hypothetical protein
MLMNAYFRISTVCAGFSDFPKGKAIAGILFFGAVGVISAFGLFASKETLDGMSGIIGTKNPLLARMVCSFGVLVSIAFVFVSVLAFLGVL